MYLSSGTNNNEEPIYIGPVKILRKGQAKTDGLQLLLGEIEYLDNNYCSLGQSLDYYERIANLDEEKRIRILTALKDIVIYPQNKNGFEDEEGFRKSLFRYIEINDDIFTLAPILISKEYNQLPSIDLKFEFNATNLQSPLVFNFDSPTYGALDEEKLPSRIIVLIGRNGSGKSTLLSKISRIAFASGPDRNDVSVKKIGSFSPSGIGFPKILNISYSAFDSFQVPGIYIHEKEQISKDISQNHGRYIFCGIRDICKELDTINDQLEVDERGKLSESEILKDRQPYTFLKPLEVIAKEYADLVKKYLIMTRLDCFLK